MYQRLRDELFAKIVSRQWQSDATNPTEIELTKTYGVSVGTVPKAVEPLVAEGLIEPSQGRGTFVRRPGLNASMGRFFRHKTNGENIIPQSRILNCTLAAPRRYTRIACD